MSIRTDIFKIQRKISFLFFAAGLFISINNFILSLSVYEFKEAIAFPGVYIVFIVSVIIFVTSLADLDIFRYVQLLLIVLIAIISILDDNESIFGLGLLFITVFISFKYGYFKRWLKIKAISFLLLTSTLMVFSSKINNEDETWVYGLNIAIYIILFFFVTFIIYSDDIKKYIEENKVKKETIESLTLEKNQLLGKLQQLDKRITTISRDHTPIDLLAYNISPAELRVIEILVVYRSTDKEIAERLNISYHTVKNHFRSIRNKLGVDRRDEILELCRFNFLE